MFPHACSFLTKQYTGGRGPFHNQPTIVKTGDAIVCVMSRVPYTMIMRVYAFSPHFNTCIIAAYISFPELDPEGHVEVISYTLQYIYCSIALAC